MAHMTKILFPVAYSPQCRQAARYAAALACRFHSELVLLHVVSQPYPVYSPPEGYTALPPEDPERTLQEHREILESFLAGEWEDLRLRRVVMEGSPAEAIVEYAHREHCDLIVMPTHGHGPFRRFLLGSVTAKVLHDAACPVWTGPHLQDAPVADSPSFRKVLCGLDLRPESREILAWAADFAREFGAELRIAHVLPVSTTRLGGFYFDPEWCATVSAAARDRIAYLQDELHTNAQVSIEVGDVPAGLRDVAETSGANLLVIGRGHPHGMLGRLRKHAYQIIRESPCPVTAV